MEAKVKQMLDVSHDQLGGGGRGRDCQTQQPATEGRAICSVFRYTDKSKIKEEKMQSSDPDANDQHYGRVDDPSSASLWSQ